MARHELVEHSGVRIAKDVILSRLITVELLVSVRVFILIIACFITALQHVCHGCFLIPYELDNFDGFSGFVVY